MKAPEFLDIYTNSLTRFPDKHVEIKRGACSIYTTIYTFLKCYDEYDYYNCAEIIDCKDSKNCLTLTLIR